MERIIHRANGGAYPENTLEAVEWAAQTDADAVEIDVMLSADGIPVLSHDRHLERLTPNRKRVGELTLSELKKLRIRSDNLKKEGTFAALGEAIEIIRGKKRLYIELKAGSAIKSLSESVLNLLDGTLSSDEFVISSFDADMLRLIKSKRKEIKTGYIFSNLFRWLMLHLIERENGGFDQWHCKKWMMRTNLVEKAHSEGKSLVPWTVNSANEMRRCIRKGADGIITDEIGLLNEVLSE
ncbi:MAG: glycerophosphodiester phosphodiesterase [Candidatus Marinimicrobia bacterium]|nr:glycerophosphodiester phosphodiesterase [Candidatus Neomarinimicrobiota bacterium]